MKRKLRTKVDKAVLMRGIKERFRSTLQIQKVLDRLETPARLIMAEPRRFSVRSMPRFQVLFVALLGLAPSD